MGAFSRKELEYLREQEVGRLATVSRRQIPHVTPVAFGVDEDRVYVNIRHTSVKARNISGNPRVSFVVDDFPPFDGTGQGLHGVLLGGKAELISSGNLHRKGRDLIYEKFPGYKEAFPIRVGGYSKYILVITPTKVLSWGL